MNPMSDDAKAILLLCGRLGRDCDAQPLEQTEYNRVVRWLLDNDMRPADLLHLDRVPTAATGSGIPQQRLTFLLRRGVQLGFAIEAWNRSGVWVICRSDPDYPTRYKTHLKEKAPPVLFGVGERSLLQGGGLAIVGSRNANAEAEDFTREVAEWCARGGVSVISGGARGIDQAAMNAALAAGGRVIGVLAEKLLKNSVAREARTAIADDRLLLISPYHPEASFTVGTAMARNRLIYALADYGLVVSADYRKGGTWAGAEEELKRQPSRPVFVRLTGSVPAGNLKLLDLGAVEFPSFAGEDAPRAVLSQALDQPLRRPAERAEFPLFESAAPRRDEPARLREAPLVEENPPQKSSPALRPAEPASIYESVLPVIVATLEEPAAPEELAKRLHVSKSQLQAWLKQAVSEKTIRKLARPVRYARREV
ncbi:MAG: DNA-processing protein DprA [Planctomycetota bacterium]